MMHLAERALGFVLVPARARARVNGPAPKLQKHSGAAADGFFALLA